MTDWKLGDYVRIDYEGGTKGWGRLEYRVTEEDVPLANGAEPGDFLWRELSFHTSAIHGAPLKPSELGTREVQDRRLWVDFPYQQSQMVVLNDLQYVALHGALKIHERLINGFDQAGLTEKNERESAERAHTDRQAKQEATKRLGGRDNTRERRKTRKETQTTAAREMAAKLVSDARFEVCGIIACQLPTGGDGPGYWDRRAVWTALQRHPAWRHQYTLAEDPKGGSMAPARAGRRAKCESDRIQREENDRSYGLKEALVPPPPPVETCDCCGQQTNSSRGPFGGRRRRTA
jgi:hypothetical protein